MAKTARILTQNLKLVDLVIEIRDARIPVSSGNPDFNKLLAGKRRLLLLSKEDLADPDVSKMWKKYYADNSIDAVFTDLKTGSGLKTVKEKLKKAANMKIARHASKGVIHRPIRAMVVGIPNSGKSTFINKLSGRSSAKTGDVPGVTRSEQWIKLKDGIDLLDTPGVLWPKFDDEDTANNLAFTGAIKDSITDTEEVTERLMRWVFSNYRECLSERYGISIEEYPNINEMLQSDYSNHVLLSLIAKRRGFLLPGGELDIKRASVIALDEFRAAKIGKISLEKPPLTEIEIE